MCKSVQFTLHNWLPPSSSDSTLSTNKGSCKLALSNSHPIFPSPSSTVTWKHCTIKRQTGFGLATAAASLTFLLSTCRSLFSTGQQGSRAKGQQGSRAKEQQGNRAAGQQGHRATGSQGNRAAGQQGGNPAGQQGDRAAGQQGDRSKGQQGHRAKGQQGSRAAGDHQQRGTGDGQIICNTKRYLTNGRPQKPRAEYIR